MKFLTGLSAMLILLHLMLYYDYISELLQSLKRWQEAEGISILFIARQSKTGTVQKVQAYRKPTSSMDQCSKGRSHFSLVTLCVADAL